MPEKLRILTPQQCAAVHNEWMRRYIEEPEKFTREYQTVMLFLAEENAGQEPSYGDRCVAYFEKLADELFPTGR